MDEAVSGLSQEWTETPPAKLEIMPSPAATEGSPWFRGETQSSTVYAPIKANLPAVSSFSADVMMLICLPVLFLSGFCRLTRRHPNKKDVDNVS